MAASIDKALNLSLAVALNPDGLRAEVAEKKSNVEHVFKVRLLSVEAIFLAKIVTKMKMS